MLRVFDKSINIVKTRSMVRECVQEQRKREIVEKEQLEGNVRLDVEDEQCEELTASEALRTSLDVSSVDVKEEGMQSSDERDEESDSESITKYLDGDNLMW